MNRFFFPEYIVRLMVFSDGYCTGLVNALHELIRAAITVVMIQGDAQSRQRSFCRWNLLLDG